MSVIVARHEEVAALLAGDGTSPQVLVLHWPAQAELVELVRSLGLPRVLLVEGDEAPPVNIDGMEDWVRLPASDEDVRFRSAVLAARAVQPGPVPRVNGDGRLVYRGRWVALSRAEEHIAAAMCEHLGEVVGTDDLREADGGPMSVNAVRVHITRLRKRIEPLGLKVRTVHGHGYVLEAVDGPDPSGRRVSPPRR